MNRTTGHDKWIIHSDHQVLRVWCLCHECHLNRWTPVSDMRRMSSTRATSLPPSIMLSLLAPGLSAPHPWSLSLSAHKSDSDAIMCAADWPLRRQHSVSTGQCPHSELSCALQSGSEEGMLSRAAQHRVTTILCDLEQQTPTNMMSSYWKLEDWEIMLFVTQSLS